ncbi:MAG: NAD(P)H-dependent oxidoreductase [Pseudomonadota bacterium]
MKILAFAASNSSQSINRQLVDHACAVLHEEIAPDTEIEMLDLNDYEMPIYSIDREMSDGIPDPAHDFFNKIGAADALIISFAEHNGLYTAAYKNLFDWSSRIEMKVYQGKPMMVMSASVGKNGGANVLKTAVGSAPYFGAEICASFAVGPFAQRFDSSERKLSDTDLAATLRQSLTTLLSTLTQSLR